MPISSWYSRRADLLPPHVVHVVVLAVDLELMSLAAQDADDGLLGQQGFGEQSAAAVRRCGAFCPWPGNGPSRMDARVGREFAVDALGCSMVCRYHRFTSFGVDGGDAVEDDDRPGPHVEELAREALDHARVVRTSGIAHGVAELRRGLVGLDRARLAAPAVVVVGRQAVHA